MAVLAVALLAGCARATGGELVREEAPLSEDGNGEDGNGGQGGSGGAPGIVTEAPSPETPPADEEASACGPEEHLCGGICTNTPASGCYADPTCTPCPEPDQGMAACTPDGHCDFACDEGYVKEGSACVCASQCCSAADCASGETCNNGVCEGPPAPPCDGLACIANCLLQGQLGICMGDSCVCQ